MGEPNVDAMLGRMTASQLAEWRDYYQVEPFGELRADIRTAVVAKIVADMFGRRKGQSPFPLSKFMAGQFLEPPKERTARTDRDRVRQAMTMARMLGWKVEEIKNG